MRVITGLAKGRHLKVPKPTTTRPMTDMVKGALFAMLQPFGLAERRVLDLYAGSGSLGIEALSRGAAWADFVEQNAGVCAIITANLALTRFADQSRVHQARVATFLARLTASPPAVGYDLVFMDPPYAAPDIGAILTSLAASPALTPEAVIVVGHSVRVTVPERVPPFRRRHQRCHGDSCFSIYLVGGEVPDPPPATEERAR